VQSAKREITKHSAALKTMQVIYEKLCQRAGRLQVCIEMALHRYSVVGYWAAGYLHSSSRHVAYSNEQNCFSVIYWTVPSADIQIA